MIDLNDRMMFPVLGTPDASGPNKNVTRMSSGPYTGLRLHFTQSLPQGYPRKIPTPSQYVKSLCTTR